jgi:hypothetical protein
VLDQAKDDTASAFERLEQSENPQERELANYITRLEAHIDKAAYGHTAAKEEKGVFTETGYLTEGEFVNRYHGISDVPLEYRAFQRPEQSFASKAPLELDSKVANPPTIVTNVKLVPFLTQLAVFAGMHINEVSDFAESLSKLDRGQYLLMVSGDAISIQEASEVYLGDSRTLPYHGRIIAVSQLGNLARERVSVCGLCGGQRRHTHGRRCQN